MTDSKKMKENRRKLYEEMKAEIEKPYSWVLTDFNSNWHKCYQDLKNEFEND